MDHLAARTSHGLQRVEDSLRGEMTHLGDMIENRLLRDQRNQVFALLGAYTALMAVVITVMQLS